jgi:hypothetical protein
LFLTGFAFSDLSAIMREVSGQRPNGQNAGAAETGLPTVEDYLIHLRHHLRVLEVGGWDVVVIDAQEGCAAVLRSALETVDGA